MISDTATITNKYTYPEYRDLVFSMAEKNKSTGPEQSAERIDATKLNAQRIKRIDKTININEEFSRLIRSIPNKWKWTVIVESWCGDGAQNVPVIAKAALLNENIELTFILRDENPEIMDQFLTNGSRSIPILICTDMLTGKLIGSWGPRPLQIAEMAKKFKKENPNISHSEFLKNLHLSYAKDKGESMQHDLMVKISSWMSCATSA